MTQNAADGLMLTAAVFGVGAGLIAFGFTANLFVGAGVALVGFAVFPIAAIILRRLVKP